MQGGAFAVDYYEKRPDLQYVYVATGGMLLTYEVENNEIITVTSRIELADYIRELAVTGTMLFAAARGAGLVAYDLAEPSQPVECARLAQHINLPGADGVKAIFNGVDARFDPQSGLYEVAAACDNYCVQAAGGVDAISVIFDPSRLPADTPFLLDSAQVISAELRNNDEGKEQPFTVALTGDGFPSGYLYVGFFAGELICVPLHPVGAPIYPANFFTVWDIDTDGTYAYVSRGTALGRFSRFTISGTELVEEPILEMVSDPGGFADIDNGLIVFATTGVGRVGPDKVNMCAFTGPASWPLTIRDAVGTLDWVFHLACRSEPDGSGAVYVADEWGGLEVWTISPTGELTLACDEQTGIPVAAARSPTGAFLSGRLWIDDGVVYAVKEGAGLWRAPEDNLEQAEPAIEWIYLDDPACNPEHPDHCDGCECLPETGARPYVAPSVFVEAADSCESRLAVLAKDRNDAVARPTQALFMVFEPAPAPRNYRCIYSEPVLGNSGSLVRAADDLLWAAADERGSTLNRNVLRVYSHCQDAALGQQVSLLGQYVMPVDCATGGITDMTIFGDYLFVAEVTAAPVRGRINVFHWKNGVFEPCSGTGQLVTEAPLGAFCTDKLPQQLVIDEQRGQLLAGCSSFDDIVGGVLAYRLDPFPPADLAEMDTDERRTDISHPDLRKAVRSDPNVRGLALDGDLLYIADCDSGLFVYSFLDNAYTGFWPAHWAPDTRLVEPALVEAPAGIMPLMNPVSVAASAFGGAVVHEGVGGRAVRFTFGLYVDQLNANGPWDGSRIHPFASIGQALTQAESGWSIFVAGGTYAESVAVPAEIKLYGGYDPATWQRNRSRAPTVLLGEREQPALTLSAGARIDGLSFTGAMGIWAVDCAPVIADCSFQTDGPGIEFTDGSGEVLRCRFSCRQGPGVLCTGAAAPSIVNCRFAGNGLAGIEALDLARPRSVDNTFFGNGGAGMTRRGTAALLAKMWILNYEFY